MAPLALLALIAAATAFFSRADAQVLDAGTPMEVRLTAATGSRISHSGDPVQATVIAPVYSDGRLLVPQGAVASGTIAQVERLGFGFKHLTSGIDFHFNRLQLPDGSSFPIRARVFKVETAKEHVDAHGFIDGISPLANLSSSVAPYLIPVLCVEPHLGIPFLGVKVMIARSPDPEIYYPAGTEAVLKLSQSAEIHDPASQVASIPSLSNEDLTLVNHVLQSVPWQRTTLGRNHPSDLVNILFLGSADSIRRAFSAAGWSGAHRKSLVSAYRMYHCMVQRVGYSMAPMASLDLNGEPPDIEFQKSLNTFAKRHHTRLWREDGVDAWLSTATEDVSYEVRDMHLTHATDPVIDNERNKVVNDLAFTGCIDSASFVHRDLGSSELASVTTDGRIAVLRINDCQHPHSVLSDEPGPQTGNRPRVVQVLVALRNEMIRMNPAFLAYETCRLFWVHEESLETPRQQMIARPQNAGALDASFPAGWTRPSVLDAQTDGLR